MPEMLSKGSEISVFLAYGWFPPDNSHVEAEEYQQKALGIAREVCQFLHDHSFEVDWDGDISHKIGLSLNWQRRNMLS